MSTSPSWGITKNQLNVSLHLQSQVGRQIIVIHRFLHHQFRSLCQSPPVSCHLIYYGRFKGAPSRKWPGQCSPIGTPGQSLAPLGHHRIQTRYLALHLTQGHNEVVVQPLPILMEWALSYAATKGCCLLIGIDLYLLEEWCISHTFAFVFLKRSPETFLIAASVKLDGFSSSWNYIFVNSKLLS